MIYQRSIIINTTEYSPFIFILPVAILYFMHAYLYSCTYELCLPVLSNMPNELYAEVQQTLTSVDMIKEVKKGRLHRQSN